MSEFRPFLDGEAQRVHSDPGALDAVRRRAERRRVIRRAAAGAVALAIAAGSLGLAYAAFLPDRQARPAGAPVPAPTTTSGTEPIAVIVEATSERVASAAATLIEAEGSFIHPSGVDLNIAVVEDASPESVTRLFCSGVAEPVGVRIRDSVFPGAELHGRIDPGSILVKVGQDFEREHRSLIAATPPAFLEIRAFVNDFLRARRTAAGAGTYLGENARAAYAAHEGGLDLLGYATHADRARVMTYDKLSPDRHRVTIRFDRDGPDTPPVTETLLIGWESGDVIVVLDAERRSA
jgi:hypothetical protein